MLPNLLKTQTIGRELFEHEESAQRETVPKQLGGKRVLAVGFVEFGALVFLKFNKFKFTKFKLLQWCLLQRR